MLGPLTFASGRDFANLKLVKDLRSPLTAALANARAHLNPSDIEQCESALVNIDSPDFELRKLSVLKLKTLIEKPVVAPAVSVTPTVDSRLRGNDVPVTQATLVSSVPKEKKTKKKSKPEPEEERTRVLSIAPKSGALSKPLNQSGLRVSPRLMGLLNKKGLTRVGDVLFLLPRAYEDRREMKKIAQLRSGEKGTIVATVKHVEETYGFKRKQFRAVLQDSSGSIAAVHYQSGPWLKAKYPVGKMLVATGEVKHTNYGWEIAHPEVEVADDVETSHVHFNRIVPIYSGFEKHEQRALRDLVFKVQSQFASQLEEPLPLELLSQLNLPGLVNAIQKLHFPDSETNLDALQMHRTGEHQRLAFDELFFLQLGLALRRSGVKKETGIAFTISHTDFKEALALLPFQPTNAQKRVLDDIVADMKRVEPMNRLIQGDVGSGKTAVALVAAALAVKNGFQVAVMAPTEILAEQHARTFSKLLAPMGVRVELLSGSGPAKSKALSRNLVAEGAVQVAVGTHALIESSVEFRKLGLVVVDEQHRFGVMQRQALRAKGITPDVMVMTATPIPRTLAMTLYGDLDVSVIDELPPGRTPIETKVFTNKQREQCTARILGELKKGHQAYVVFPLVEESEKVDLLDATQGAANLAAEFPDYKIGLLHGRMKQTEKDSVMKSFREKQIDILVSTTVIEVGVDVPNASVMLIEHAERFGLSQLHQLRGRVGRGAAQSHCLLMSGYAKGPEAKERLGVMEASTDGFVIAEKDLEIRGPGEFLGTRQSGVPELAVANLARDQALLARAQVEARKIVEADPQLKNHLQLQRALEERWDGRLQLAQVG
jgi:ATP-dependent DNA helicase RecG